MPLMPPQLVQISCPNCGSVFRTEVYHLIDVGQQPEMKQAMMAGHINVAMCATCGAASMIAAPLVYHDAKKQLCFVFIPPELNLRSDEEERFIGEITNTIINNLPASTSRAYLLTPRRFISFSSLVDTILEADGIPREVVELQRNRLELITSLVEALDNETRFTQLVNQNRDSFTYEFFMMVGALIDASAQEQQDESAQLLTRMREKLLQLTGCDGDVSSGTGPPVNIEELIKKLELATNEELEEIIAEARPVLDYTFFQTWTARIESIEQAGRKEEAQGLYHRRSIVLEIVEQIDKEAQEIFESSTNLLREVLGTSNPESILHQKSESINEAFMLVISANIDAAKRDGKHEVAAQLEHIYHLAVQVIQSKLPPDERLINELLMTENLQERTTLLRKNVAIITPAFVKKMNELADEQEKRGIKEIATHLRQLAREAGAMLF